MEKIKFARFGGLSPVVQKGYTTDSKKRAFHTPPARKGIYAFIWPYYEFFLLGGTNSKVSQTHAKFEYLKDKNGNKIKYSVVENGVIKTNPELKKYFVKGKCGNYNRNCGWDETSGKIWYEGEYAVIKKSPKIFTHTGEIWHHLKNKTVKPGDIIAEVGSWIKTDYDTFVRAFNYDKISNTNYQKKLGYRDLSEINPKRAYKGICIDHLEVFIERIK